MDVHVWGGGEACKATAELQFDACRSRCVTAHGG
jgi:hypothetical protein